MANVFPLLFIMVYYEACFSLSLSISSLYIIFNIPSPGQVHKNNDNNKNTQPGVPNLYHLLYRHY